MENPLVNLHSHRSLLMEDLTNIDRSPVGEIELVVTANTDIDQPIRH